MLDRLLRLVGEDADDVARSKATAFRRFLLLLLAVESWEALHHWAGKAGFPAHVGIAVVLTSCAALAWNVRLMRWATGVGALAMAAEIVLAFPRNANHHWLGLVLLALLTLFAAGRADEDAPLLEGLRWIAVIGLFWAGSQKVLYGYYFGGEFLTYAVARSARFAEFFALFVPADELARVRAIEYGPGAGPYRIDSPLFVLVSNLAYLPELLLPPLLLWCRTRLVGLTALVVYLFAIEIGAREVFFGLLMLQLLLLFTERDWNRRLLPVFVAFTLYLLAMSAGLLPRWEFT